MEDSTSNLQSLTARIEKLEGQNRLLKRSGLTLFLVAATLIVFGQARPIRTVEAQTQPLQRDRDPNAMIAFRGGSGSHLLPLCQAAVKIGSGQNGPLTINTTPEGIQDAVNGSYCGGYISGIVDTLTEFKSATASGYTSGLTKACVPRDAESDQLNRIVAKYLNDNPAKLNVPAEMLIVSAMNEAFPCN